MMIAIGSDHGGVKLKDFLVQFLLSRGLKVEDLGTRGSESVDYPAFGRWPLRWQRGSRSGVSSYAPMG